MKKLILGFSVILFLVCYICISIPVTAVNTGFQNCDITEEMNEFISSIEFNYIAKEPQKRGFSCFDVNEKGLIVLGYQNSTVVVYDSDGLYMYGYQFNIYGLFGVEWDNDNINIYFVRAGKMLSVDSKGNALGLLRIENSLYNNSYYHNKMLSKNKVINDREYVIKDILDPLNILSTERSQVVVINGDGTEDIIFDVTIQRLILRFFLYTIIILFIIIVIKSVLRKKLVLGSLDTIISPKLYRVL